MEQIAVDGFPELGTWRESDPQVSRRRADHLRMEAAIRVLVWAGVIGAAAIAIAFAAGTVFSP